MKPAAIRSARIAARKYLEMSDGKDEISDDTGPAIHQGNDDLYGGAGNDNLSVLIGEDLLVGGRGDDTIDARDNGSVDGMGTRDTIRGGPGNDTINTRGYAPDDIDCGQGTDVVVADTLVINGEVFDTLAPNCEP